MTSLIKTSYKFPPEIKEKLRKIAEKKRRSMTSILVELIERAK